MGIRIGDFDLGIGIGIRDWNRGLRLENEIGDLIGDWNWGLELGIGIGDWDWGMGNGDLDLGLGLWIGDWL